MANRPVLSISANLDKKKTIEKINKDLENISKSLKLTIGVDKDANKNVKGITEEKKKQLNIEKQIELAKERTARTAQKQMDIDRKLASDKTKQFIQDKVALEKQTNRQVNAEKMVSAELDKQRQKLALFQADMDRKATKLTSGKFGSTVNTASLTNLQSQVGGLSIGSQSDIKTVQKEMSRLNSEFKNIALNAQQARTGFTRFADEAKNSLIKFSEFFLIGGVVVGVLGQIQSAISTIYDLSNALNEIRIVTGMSVEETNKLGESYNKLAISMSATTQEITKSASDLFRQGLNPDEVETRLQAIIKYSKISGLSVEESTNIITANANATGRSVNDIIDIMAKLGDETASGADEIGLAMAKVAGSAKVAGIPFEQLAAQIATVSSKTRESASVIGGSFKSILARYGSIKETGFNDEDSSNLNDITKALKSIGIQATDTQGQLRPFGEVIDEIGAKFMTLDRNTQGYIATTLGGKVYAPLYGNI